MRSLGVDAGRGGENATTDPRKKRRVVGDAAQRAERQMNVGRDEPGRDHHPRSIRAARLGCMPRPDVDDDSVLGKDPTPLDGGPVDRHDPLRENARSHVGIVTRHSAQSGFVEWAEDSRVIRESAAETPNRSFESPVTTATSRFP